MRPVPAAPGLSSGFPGIDPADIALRDSGVGPAPGIPADCKPGDISSGVSADFNSDILPDIGAGDSGSGPRISSDISPGRAARANVTGRSGFISGIPANFALRIPADVGLGDMGIGPGLDISADYNSGIPADIDSSNFGSGMVTVFRTK